MQINREEFVNDNSITINDVEYIVPARVQSVQDALKNHAKTYEKLSEYQQHFGVVKIILGLKVAKEIFKSEKEENLDFMANVSYALTTVYSAERTKLERENIEKLHQTLTPVAETISKIGNGADKLLGKK